MSLGLEFLDQFEDRFAVVVVEADFAAAGEIEFLVRQAGIFAGCDDDFVQHDAVALKLDVEVTAGVPESVFASVGRDGYGNVGVGGEGVLFIGLYGRKYQR